MSRFKFVLQKIFLGLMLFTMAACQLPEPQKVDVDDTASYFVAIADGKFTTTTNHPLVSIPTSKTMSLTACLKESTRSRDILSHMFIIKGGEKDQRIQTDSRGCLIWEEELAFNYMADEDHVTIQRTLVPEGQQQGHRTVEFIVNPWLGRIYSALDSRVKNPVPVEKSKLSLQGTSQKDRRSLWLDWVRLNVMQEKIAGQKGSYIMEVSATLLLERMDERKERVLIPISYGKVVGRIQLICAMHPDGRDPMRVVIAQMDNMKAEVVNGNKIFLNSKFTLTEFCPTTAFLMAGISVEIPNGPALLAPFQGLYHGGPVAGMVGPMFSVPDGTFMDRFMKDKSYTIERYLADNKAIYRNGTKAFPMSGNQGQDADSNGSSAAIDPVVAPSGTVFPSAQNPDSSTPDLLQKFRIEVRELQGMTYGFQQQYYKERTLTYRVRACLRLGIDQQAIRAATFKVHKVNGRVDNVTTLDDGCLEFEDSLAYNHFAKECWFEKVVRLTNSDYGFDESFKIQINPWNNGSQWFKDVRWLPQTDRVARCADRGSQILLDYYFMDYSTGRYQYRLDEQMNLSQTRVANISIRPLLYRQSFGAATGYVTENLPAGKYLVRFALVDQGVTDYSNLAALKDRIYLVDRTMITVREDGTITDQIGFTLPNESLISLGLLNQFVIEMMPLREDAVLSRSVKGAELESFVDANHAIQLVPFVAQFVHRAEGGGLRKLENYIGQSLVLELEKSYLKSKAEIKQSLEKLSTKEALAWANGLTLINLNQEPQATRFRTVFANSSVKTNSRAKTIEPIPLERIQKFMQTGTFDRQFAINMCGFIFQNLWTQKLPGKDYTLLSAKDSSETMTQIYDLHMNCVHEFIKAPSEAFDIEYKYFVNQPELVGAERCVRDDAGQEKCFTEVGPERVDPRTFSVSKSFALSKSYNEHIGNSANFEMGASIAKFLGAGGGYGYSMSTADDASQLNMTSFSNDLSLIMETLQFKVKAASAERCVMVRLNPALFDREKTGLWAHVFGDKESVMNRYLNPSLTPEERATVRQKGVLICDGAATEKPLEFKESYYLVRPNTPEGLLGDERSRATVQGLLITLRGINDMTSFMSQVTHSEKIPASFQRELQARQLDTTRLREAFLRGTRAMPGVYSTVRPLK